MDRLTVLGLLIAFGSVVLGQWLGGGSLAILLNVHAFLIVVGGTIGVVMLQSPWNIFAGAIRHLAWAFFPPRYSLDELSSQLQIWGASVRYHGFLSLEEEYQNEPNDFCQQGLALLIDGIDTASLQEVLEQRMDVEQQRLECYARIYESMGGYSPTIGILGAVLGLIQAMSFLDNPDQLGSGIAVAFVATIYGVGFANLLYLPIANKLRQIFYQYSVYQDMVVTGIVSISRAETSLILERRLNVFLSE
ncbi:MAG: Chemotaxis protein PomA [Candidatus Celerinatantimonas neptuna]|nr:MAG: Chemotaxis protein PomA [Candidatus Celerinatantimonas neptuna]